MSVGSVTAKNALLTATIGDGRASNIPAVLYLAMFNGDPTAGGTELNATGGYTRTAVAWTSAVWSAPSGGVCSNAVAIQTAVATAAWSAGITHVAFMDSATLGAGNQWDTGALTASVTVSTGNTVVRFEVGALGIQVA